jgi:oligopeptidase B
MPVMRPSLASAREIVGHRPEVMLEGLDVFAGHLVLAERDRGVQRLQVFDLADGSSHPIALPEELCSVWTSDNEEFDTTQLRLSLTSLVTPESVFDYDMSTRVLTLRKREPVLGGYDPARYASCRMQAEAADGTWVPISLVWRRDLRAPGPQSLLLTGYGAYGVPHDVYFSSTRLSLLDRGVVVAFAHVRGGGDLGRTWYDAGKLAHKMNTFTDFIACAEHLVQAGWTAPAQLVIEGASAGGLLMGAVTNMRPELFRAVVAEVPFLDVIHTMLDESLPLTVGEFLEWGNPKKAADYRVMRAYSPYDNLQRGPYPAIYLRTSLHDSQVACWEPAKYAARLRTLKTDDNPLLLSINLEAGHGGASGRYDALHERAEVLTFMLAQWGLAHGPAPLPAGEKR